MSNRTLQKAEYGRSAAIPEVQRDLDAWLRLALAEEFGRVVREPVPDWLLHLLPEE